MTFRGPTKSYLWLIFTLLNFHLVFSQFEIKGIVVDKKASPLESSNIQVLETGQATVTDKNGAFSLVLPKGNFNLLVTNIGYKSAKRVINPLKHSKSIIKITLEETNETLNSITIEAKTKSEKIKEQAFEVEAIEIKEQKNASVDVNEVLAGVSGVNIRQSGGLGSSFNFSLNGFTNNQVRFFINGIPQDNLGSSLTLNNFPATLVERVEVYKGVVPVFLGTDALGGAINIVTNQEYKNFLDVSYDIGSFNTHRATLNGHYYTAKGFAFQLSSFYNYSDNDYDINVVQEGIEGIPVRDNLGNISSDAIPSVNRFHSAYESQMIQAKAGVIDKWIADKLLVGITASANDQEIQHGIESANPFGEVTQKEQVVLGSLEYKKKLIQNKLHLKLYTEIAQRKSKLTDTSSNIYDWLGNTNLNKQPSQGELGIEKLLFEFTDKRNILNASASYHFNKTHSFDFNYTKNYLKRQGKDDAKSRAIPFEFPNNLDKNTLGFSYNIKDAFNKRFNANLFGKLFLGNVTTTTDEAINDTSSDLVTRTLNYDYSGYGAAISYKILYDLQVKASYENTYRIPDANEFFGNGLLIESNPNLLPESSQNINLGTRYTLKNKDLKLTLDANYFFRNSENYIRLGSLGVLARYVNISKTQNRGLESEVQLNLFNKFYIGGNVTYQNLERIEGGNRFRISNEPYLYGNFNLGANLENVFKTKTNLAIKWYAFYVNEFPLLSFEEGNPEDRQKIPTQISHNLQLDYSISNGKYNISFLTRNITDERVFDNFLVQQPGRSFSIKFRYLLKNFN